MTACSSTVQEKGPGSDLRLYLQIGNPDGADKPNKKFYDPRVWIRAAEESMIKRAHEGFKNLNGVNVCGDSWPKAS